MVSEPATPQAAANAASSGTSVTPQPLRRPSPPAMKKRMNPMLRFGLPMILFVVSGSFILSKFVENQVEVKDKTIKKGSERAVQLEMAHAAIVGKLKLDDYELRPVPKPAGEEEETVQPRPLR